MREHEHGEQAAPDHPKRSSLTPVVRQPGQSGHDGALSGALPQLRADPPGAAIRQADHRHRPDRLGPLALQSPPHRTRQARPRRDHGGGRACDGVPVSSDPGDRKAPDRLPRPQSLVSQPCRSALRLPARRRRAAHRLRQDPACLMAAATVNIPAISLNVGPMLNGWSRGDRTGSGTIVWKARERHAAGDIDYQQFIDIVASSAPSVGHCNTMGTASTMNALAEALGMSLPGSAAIPAPYRERGQMAYESGKRIVEMVWEDLKPSDILTREAFENAIVANAAIGGSTNAPVHINAIANHIGVPLDNGDWERIGFEIPLLVKVQPAGEYLGEEYYRAGGLPAVMAELIGAEKIHEGAITCTGTTIGEN